MLAFINRQRDDMFAYPIQLCYRQLFGEHGYALPAAGLAESVKILQREQLRTWSHKHFNPANMLVTAVGDFEAERLRDLIENKLRLSDQEPHRFGKQASPPYPDAAGRQVESRDKKQTAIALAYPGPDYRDPDYYNLLVLQNIVSGLGGRFFEELRGRQNLAYNVTAYLVSRAAGGAFVSYIATSPENETRALQGLQHELDALKITPVSDIELQAAIHYTIGTHRIGLETYRARVQQLAHDELLGRSAENAEQFEQQVRMVTPESILAAVHKYFDNNRSVLGMIRGNHL